MPSDRKMFMDLFEIVPISARFGETPIRSGSVGRCRVQRIARPYPREANPDSIH